MYVPSHHAFYKSLSIIDTNGRPDNMVIGSCKVGNWNGWGDLAKGGSTSYVRKESAILSKRCTVVRQIFTKRFFLTGRKPIYLNEARTGDSVDRLFMTGYGSGVERLTNLRALASSEKPHQPGGSPIGPAWAWRVGQCRFKPFCSRNPFK